MLHRGMPLIRCIVIGMRFFWRQNKRDSAKSFEVVGAYVLFPADEATDGRLYPYEDLLNEQNIGAFPLLPNRRRSGE